MDNASKNASDMISSLQMQYNRGRQASITNELVDIITGSCASLGLSFAFLTYTGLLQVPVRCKQHDRTNVGGWCLELVIALQPKTSLP